MNTLIRAFDFIPAPPCACMSCNHCHSPNNLRQPQITRALHRHNLIRHDSVDPDCVSDALGKGTDDSRVVIDVRQIYGLYLRAFS